MTSRIDSVRSVYPRTIHRSAQFATIAALSVLAGNAFGLDQKVRIQNPDASVSLVTRMDSNHASQRSFVSKYLIVDAASRRALENALQGINGVEIARTLNAEGTRFAIETPSVSQALDLQSTLAAHPSITRVSLDERQQISFQDRLNKLIAMRGMRARAAESLANGRGILLPKDQTNPQGGAGDPFGPDWFYVNGTTTDHDNNILPSIYDADGIFGTDIAVGIAVSTNQHFDEDHTDLVTNYDRTLSMDFDPVLFPDNRTATGYAGIVAAERDNGIGIQGVAPRSSVASFIWGDTDFLSYEGFAWLNNDIDIKVYQTTVEFDVPGAQYVTGRVSDYVTDALENSIKFGRNGKGVVNLFGAGVGFNLLPDPYFFPPAVGDSFSPTDTMQASGNAVSEGITDGYATTPLYVGGQINHYPLATDRRSIVINTVSEDGFYDSLSGHGPGVFASVYAGSSNEIWSGSQAISGRGARTTIPGGGGASGLIPIPGDPIDIFNANGTGTSVAAGIIALMLDANPKLSIRDIQHILFESIQDSTKPASAKWPDFDITRQYYFPNDPLARRMSFWQVNTGLYNSDTVTNQAIRHSDQYGFGVIDAELAVQKALTWQSVPPLVLLDSGVVGDINDGGEVTEDPRVPLPIPDAVYNIVAEADASGINGSAFIIPGDNSATFNFCIRNNIQIEAVYVELTIEGTGSNDLYIDLTSPTGTRSIMLLPSTLNTVGSSDSEVFTDDELDQAYTSGVYNGTTYAFWQHPFLSWKHWGELAGGRWALTIQDHGVDDQNPEGAEPNPPDEPGADMITALGEIGVPGSEFRDEKEIVAFRIRIYGTEVGEPVFPGCNPGETSCPADMNGDGKIDTEDFFEFLSLYLAQNELADLNGDGVVNYSDLSIYRGLWIPGFCSPGLNPFIGGRPNNDSNFGSDNNPVVHPI